MLVNCACGIQFNAKPSLIKRGLGKYHSWSCWLKYKPKTRKKLGKWSRKFDECIQCKTIKSTHHANGICWRCIRKNFRMSPNGKAKRKEYLKKYFKKEYGKMLLANRKMQYRQIDPSIKSDITPRWLLQLAKSTTICPLCNIQLEEPNNYPNGKSFDHIKPLGIGGLHMQNNIRIICRGCNAKRSKLGKDLEK